MFRVRSLVLLVLAFLFALSLPSVGPRQILQHEDHYPKGGSCNGPCLITGVPIRPIDCGTSGPRIEALYVRNQWQPDRIAAARPTIKRAILGADAVLLNTAKSEGHTARLKIFSYPTCGIVVHEVVTDQSLRTFEEDRAVAQGYGYGGTTSRIWVLFVDNDYVCGEANVISDSNPDPAKNLNNINEHYSVLGHDCWQPYLLAHELGHNMGAVQLDAPHSTGAFHCTDNYDVMCYPDGGPKSQPQLYLCPTEPVYYDCGRDDYFSYNPKSDYLKTHWNLVNSRWIIHVS